MSRDCLIVQVENFKLEIEKNDNNNEIVFTLNDGLVISSCEKEEIFIEMGIGKGYFCVQADQTSYSIYNMDYLGRVAEFLQVDIRTYKP